MKLKRLEVEGYKSLKHVVWEPGDLNVLIGPNGSGKSNLLRLLEMLSASARGELREFIKKDGGVKSLFWDLRSDEININLCASQQDKGNEENQNSMDLSYHLQLTSPDVWNVHEISNEVLSEKDGVLIDTTQTGFRSLRRDNNYAEGRGRDSVESILYHEGHHRECASQTRNFAAFLTNFKCFYNFNVGYNSPIRQPNITRYDKDLKSDGSNLINFLHTRYSEDSLFKDQIDTAMNAAFGINYHGLIFSPAADQYIQMRVRWKHLNWQQSANVLSDGILKYLILISIFISSKDASIIAIDEPEIGLHPAMFSIIAEYAEEASQNTQVIFTTHSPEFLDAFDEVTPTVTVFDWVDGETEMRTLSGEKLQYWLKEYKMGEMFKSGGLEAI